MAQTGRAELLRALHLGAGNTFALEHDDHVWWGYERQPEIAAPLPSLTIEVPEAVNPLPGRPAPPLDVPVDDPLRQPLQMPVAWVLHRQDERDLPQELQGLPKLTEAELGALASEPLPYRDLVPWARALPGLRRHTDRQVAGGIDWPRLSTALARQELPRRLPRRHWQRWPQQVILVLDFSPRLAPYRWDFHRLALQLDAHLPAAALLVRVLQHGPAGPWTAWPHPRRPRPWQPAQDWEVQLAPGTVVLLATDLGLFDDQAAVRQAWLDWGDALREQGCRLIALAPLGAAQITEPVLKRFELVRWSPDSRWRRERRAPAPLDAEGAAKPDSSAATAGMAAAPAANPALEALVALAATALRIDPPLLRAWRGLLPGGGDAGLEGRLWNHPHLQPAGLTCATRGEHLDADLARHGTLPAALRDAARAVHAAQHAHLRQSLSHGEALRWCASGQAAAIPGDAGKVAPVDAATAAARDDPLGFVKRLLHTLGDPGASPAATSRRSLIGAAELIQAAASPAVRAQDPVLFTALDAAVARWRLGLAAGGAGQGDDDATGPPRLWMLVQQGPALALAPTVAAGPGQPLGMPVLVPATTPGVWLQSPARSWWLPLPAEHDQARAGIELATLGDGHEQLTVSLDRHAWTLVQVSRPGWAAQWRCAKGGLSAAVPSPAGRDAAGQQELAWFQDPQVGQMLIGAGAGRANVGLDEHGAFAELALRRPEGQGPTAVDLVLRLRWIPSGRFLMGSPEGQGTEDEHPQHPVLISQGFWLAERPCTQALWQAVMGGNPSHFKNAPDAAQRPVEQVTFDDVLRFLQRLRAWLPEGCDPVLPSEAQWEYAARAGTTTAYPWGDAPDDTFANWDELHQGTTPVGQFSPNPWGLFDMHGNVWEWCADDRRGYSPAPQRDPHGETHRSSRRAVRGGSWILRPGRARSAFRNDGRLDDQDLTLGFRLALRSSIPAPGGHPAEPGPGRSGVAAVAGRLGGDVGLVQSAVSRVLEAFSPGRKDRAAGKKGPR